MWKTISRFIDGDIRVTLRFDTEAIRLITLFENITGAGVKDCVIDNSSNTVFFIIEEGKIGIAIGKNGNSVKKAENIIGKNIKLFEFSKNLNSFIKNLIPQCTEIKIKNEYGRVSVEVKIEKSERGIVIGRDKKNINVFKEILQRNYGVDELIVR